MILMKRKSSYSKMDKDDPEEVKHRRAQFLIYKAMEETDSSMQGKTPSFLSVRLGKLKTKIGNKLRKLRKNLVIGMSVARCGVRKQFSGGVDAWTRLFGRRGGAGLPAPIFRLEV